MKRKLLSLLLVITLLAITVSTGIPTILASDENLFTNGDFSDYSGYTPTNWNVRLQDGVGTATIEKAKPDGVNEVNALHITTNADGTGTNNGIHGLKTFKVERNARYTITYWVKNTAVKGIRFYLYEPNYLDRNGNQQSNWSPHEGQNIYTYSYDNGTTRVSRTDVRHSIALANGTPIEGHSVSMAIARVNDSTPIVVTADYPSQEKPGEWVQIVHTFETGNDVAHEADVTYGILFPSAVGGDVWIADFKANVVKSEISDYYLPAVNDLSLGVVAPYVESPMYDGKATVFTAEPLGENTFEGWYNNDTLVSTEPAIEIVYDAANPNLNYVAKFKKTGNAVVETYESSATGKVATAHHADTTSWTETGFKTTSSDGIHFVDSIYGGVWREASITSDRALTGEKSLTFFGAYGLVGHKFTGLAKNTNYTASFYVYTKADVSSEFIGVRKFIVTDANSSSIKRSGTNLVEKGDGDAGVLGYKRLDVPSDAVWKKVTVDFNTKDNTDVILWISSSGKNARQYIDNLSVARKPDAFKASVNDANLGYVDPVEGIVVRDGDEVTVNATPLEGNAFDGWYLNGNKVSDSRTFTFTFTSEYASNLVAHFTKGATNPANAGYETGYTNDQLVAQIIHTKDITHSETEWTEDLFLDTTKDGIHFVEAQYGGNYRKSLITTEQAHGGKYSLKFTGLYGYFGRKFVGLTPNTNYAISFYTYLTGTNNVSFGSLSVTPADETIIETAGNIKPPAKVLARSDKKCSEMATWTRMSIEFNSGDNTEVMLWGNLSGDGACAYLDDFALFQPIDAAISGELGGTVSSDATGGKIAAGTRVTVKAEPLDGNTFAGWYDAAGKLVSTDAEYVFIANESFTLVAKFDGFNKPPLEIFTSRGMDGTFEKGTISGFEGSDNQYECSWCTWTRSTNYAFEGDYSLRAYARYRNTILPLTDLNANTNYKLTMYILQPDSDAAAKINSIAIADINEKDIGGTGVILKQNNVTADSGWNKYEIYFNTGSKNALNLMIRFSTDNTNGALYFDNMSLYQYDFGDELINGDFEDGRKNWIGSATVSDGALSLQKNETAWQGLNADTYTCYNVKFRAKGKVTAAALNVGTEGVTAKDYISAVSFVETEGDWKEYEFDVFTSIHHAYKLAFIGNEDGALVDDVTISVVQDTTRSIIEKIDFESERFAINSERNPSFSIYTATDENDPYVLNGKKSLKFTYNELLQSTNSLLDEAFLTYPSTVGKSLKITFNYKLVEGRAGGYINFAPEYSNTYGGEFGFQHMAENKEWQSVTIFLTPNSANPFALFKLCIGNVALSTACDFYIDDIVISLAPPMVGETNTTQSYCEELYNAIDNSNFEQPITNANWKNLPSTVKVMSGNALKGDKYLRANAGTHYVLEVDVDDGQEYYFGASVRGTAATKGYIGISTDSTGNSLYIDYEENPASKITTRPGESGWTRNAFRFSADVSGKAYIVIDVDAGYLDLDSIMLFRYDYAYSYDPNDYTVYIPYDYDNLKSSSTVINGGFGEQPYFKSTALGYSLAQGLSEGGADIVYEDDDSSPATGDSAGLPIALIITALAFAMIVLIVKRKEGAANA